MTLAPSFPRNEPRLTVALCVHNEEQRLRACLDRLRFADELVIVLDRCVDGSRAIALEYGAKILEGAWEIEGHRRMAAIESSAGPWILEIDADEHVPPELAQAIRETLQTTTADWRPIKVDNYIGRRLVRHGWGAAFGITQKTILFRKGFKEWGEQRVHPKIKRLGAPGTPLSPPLMHYVDHNITDMIDRLNRYTTAHARDLRDAGLPGESLRRNIGRFFARFYKCYVGRKGYKEGEWGVLIAFMAGLYPLLSYLKARLDETDSSE
ncbi:(heptosyl)LPS beta-1,4-glucosyltransferase [Azospirillaceae bacterium]